MSDGPAPLHHHHMPTAGGGSQRAPVISPILLMPAGQLSTAVLSDERDRRAVLVELRTDQGAPAEDRRVSFLDLFHRVFRAKSRPPEPVPVGRHYMRCVLTPAEVERLVQGGARPSVKQADEALGVIYRVGPDLVVEAQLDRSLTTIQADAAVHTYNCDGSGIVWAVLDSGIDKSHPHFAGGTLSDPRVARLHRDFTIATASAAPQSATIDSALTDPFGHGTHVAGIIAGQAPAEPQQVRIATNDPITQGLPRWVERPVTPGGALSGTASRANLVSLRVLDDNGRTLSSAIIDAIDYVRTVNGGGRSLVIHGVNLSLGCGWFPRDYAAGQSPLCRELDLLVGTGVVAVVSAGNLGAGVAGAGAGATITGATSDVYGQLSTITDPGNAAAAITVGSVHRYRPHTYGVSFNSSKGPTLDGRRKPDLVAPGDRITSAATGRLAEGIRVLDVEDVGQVARYAEDSGTSMAAAHVSGVVAAFLSARTEFVGRPDEVKKILLESATDLGRHEFYQGAGLVNLMRALTNT